MRSQATDGVIVYEVLIADRVVRPLWDQSQTEDKPALKSDVWCGTSRRGGRTVDGEN